MDMAQWGDSWKRGSRKAQGIGRRIDVRVFYSWPRTHPVRGATLNLFQKTRGLGSGNWCWAKISEVVVRPSVMVRTISPFLGDGSVAVGSVAVGSVVSGILK